MAGSGFGGGSPTPSVDVGFHGPRKRGTGGAIIRYAVGGGDGGGPSGARSFGVVPSVGLPAQFVIGRRTSARGFGPSAGAQTQIAVGGRTNSKFGPQKGWTSSGYLIGPCAAKRHGTGLGDARPFFGQKDGPFVQLGAGPGELPVGS